MNVYMTNGTFDFLQKIKTKFQNESMILMEGPDSALLLHESNSKTVFKAPRKYTVIDSAGNFDKARFVVMNHIPVTDEGRPVFEHRFKNRDRNIEKQKGFAGIRVLRPLSSDTYVILTVWENEESFDEWRKSEAFGKSHGKPTTENGGSATKKIFAGASYVKKYWIPKDEVENA